jgi:hypothetical protein
VLLEYGDISKIKGLNWYLCELRSEKTIESTMKRVGKALSGIFHHDPVEIFIPVVKRDLDVFSLSTGPYIFVRSTSFPGLLRLKQITGVVSLVTEGESNRPSKAIPVEDSYVQGLIAQAEEEHRNRAVGIEVGSFVRILNGETRDYCGVVGEIGDGRAVVRITLQTKSILLETPIRNLLNISHVPVDQRVYYYGPLVENLVKDQGDAGLALIEEDRHMNENVQPIEVVDEPTSDEPKRHSRQRTVTALVKKLVLIEGQYNPLEIAKSVVSSLKKKEIKAPKNMFIVYNIIKDRLMKDHFKKIDPNIHNYRDVIKKFGREFKFSAHQIYRLDSELGIPILTQDICKDGRSREARQKSRKPIERKVQKKHKVPAKKKKLPSNKCGECNHERRTHKISPRGTWAHCQEKVHFRGKNKICVCKRFKEHSRSRTSA